MLTAFGKLSRNRTFGFRLSQGEKLNDLISSIGTVEGLYTLRVLYKFGQEKNIELPITKYS
jgi:glycerol-3-phosphate dehydrogenase